MANEALPSKVITDTHTLLRATRAVYERVSPRAGAPGVDARRLVEQLRLLFIDSGQALFVFGAPDEATLASARVHAQAPLERALEAVFEEKIRLELVVYEEGRTSLADLIAAYSRPGDRMTALAGSDQPEEASTLSAETNSAKEQADAAGGTPEFDKIQLGLLQSNLRGVFTSPKRVVVVPGYLLRWLPYLGPLRTSIIVACFQAFYLCRRTTARANQTFEAPGPFLAALSGAAESSIWRHLNDPELAWFLQKAPYGPDEERWVRDEKAGVTKKRPTRLLFRATSPLTPVDAQALSAYLMDLDIQEDPIGVLRQLVRGEYRIEPRDVFPFPPPPPPENWQEADPEHFLVQNVIYAAIGVQAKWASKEMAALVDALVERLLPANDQLHISWYYLLHWQPLLGHGPGWATILLRDRCFYNRQTGELRDVVALRGGYQELADALGLQRVKTVREWFPAPHAQKKAVKNADLASPKTLKKIARSKRQFVREYAARFVEIVEADADGRGQVSSCKARVKIFDPLTPTHEALYNALFPLAQGYFRLPPERRKSFLKAYEQACLAGAEALQRLVQESDATLDDLIRQHGLTIQPGCACTLEEETAQDVLGAFERITREHLGADRRVTPADLGAFEEITAGESGANAGFTPKDLGGIERLTALLAGAFEKIENNDAGAFERLGLVFWAHMRGLKHIVLNNHLDQTLKDYFQNTSLENSERLTSPTTSYVVQEENDAMVGVEADPEIKYWDLAQLLNNFSPHVKRALLERNVSLEAVLSCLFYIASSKGDNLGLGYVVEKLKAQPQEGQGGIYLRLAGAEPQEIVARLRTYLDYRSFQDRDWRVAMGTPSAEKILELLEHLGLDSSQFGRRWD